MESSHQPYHGSHIPDSRDRRIDAYYTSIRRKSVGSMLIDGDQWLFVICGPVYKHGLTLIPARISNHMPYKVWYEITYPFLNFNGATLEV